MNKRDRIAKILNTWRNHLIKCTRSQIQNVQYHTMPKLPTEIADEIMAIDDTRDKYQELLDQVKNKIPGETRHETALRIIRQHENQDNPPESHIEGPKE